jgi:DNA-binding transcriptional ArsR family regulator
MKQLPQEQADEWASWFRCLSDGTRVRVLHVVATADGPLTVGEIVSAVGRSQSTVSEHLRILADERFVRVNTSCMRALPEAAEVIMGDAVVGVAT